MVLVRRSAGVAWARWSVLCAVAAISVNACGDGERTDYEALVAGQSGDASSVAGHGGSGGVSGASGDTSDAGAGQSGGSGMSAGGSNAEGGTDASGASGGTSGGTSGDGGSGALGGASGSAGSGGSMAGGGGTAGTGEHPGPTCDEPTGELPALKLTPVGYVDDPVQLVSPPNDPRLFVVSRGGSIHIINDGAVVLEPFLDVGVDLHYSELGLLGLAFHPQFKQNGLFYLHRILPRTSGQDTGDLVIEEYQRDSTNPNASEPTPRRELIRIPQPSHKHKAGTMFFDPEERLYIAIGNGGEQPASHDTTLLRGKILRIDPNIDGDSYVIPEDNPQLDGWAPEIIESGLRNPWRISFDACTGDVYIGDVGNETFEEIDVAPAGSRGRDFGFPVYEGLERNCKSCEDIEQTVPVTGYTHAEGCAIIGGVVYRGHAIPALRGAYLYSDLCEGFFRTFRYEDGKATDEQDLTEDLNPDGIKSITSFGTDRDGEVYVMSRDTGTVYRIEPE